MAAYPIPKRLKLSLTPAFAVAVGVCVALACMLMPSDVLEVLILDSGVPALIPAAEPPLGWTARTALAMIAGGGAAAAAWLGAFLLLGGEGVVVVGQSRPAKPAKKRKPDAIAQIVEAAPVPVLRRADAHPDAPPRAPLLATRDLGVPFLDVRAPRGEADEPVVVEPVALEPAERDLPRDLDAPLSDFDPSAIPATPAEPVRAVAPLSAVRNPAVTEDGERFEAFELRPPVQAPLAQPPIAAPRTDATIHALLDRLERGVHARAADSATAAGGIDSALDELRRLATR